MALNHLLTEAALHAGTYWYVGPYFNQAKGIVWLDSGMLPKYTPQPIWDKRNNTECYIPIPNGSVIHIKGADKPQALRGPNPLGVILDEYDDMKPEIWQEIIRPIMTANMQAWTWFLGTYKGKRDLFAKYHYAQETEGWFGSELKASQSGIIDKVSLEESRKEAEATNQLHLWMQEMELEPYAGGNAVFRRVDENMTITYNQPEYGHQYQLGVDLAKYRDFTVITPFDLQTFKIGQQERFNQIDWNLQKARIEATALRYNNAKIIIDETGMGEPIVEDLERMNLNVEGFKFTEKSRAALLENLTILLEQDKIKLPADRELKNELLNFEFSIGSRGKIRAQAPEGLHDDRVMSLALAVWRAGWPLPANDEQTYKLYSSQYA